MRLKYLLSILFTCSALASCGAGQSDLSNPPGSGNDFEQQQCPAIARICRDGSVANLSNDGTCRHICPEDSE